MNQSREMIRIIYDALAEKKGEDIKIIDISQVSVIADYFVIVNGNSDSQIQALIDSVEEKMHQAGYTIKQREGSRGGSWVLLDYGDVIVHVFDKESRSFYHLEHIWNDGKIVDIRNCKE